MVLLQPESTSSRPGAGGKYCKNGVDLRGKFTPDEAKQHAKDYAKKRDAKKTRTTTSIGKIPIVVRTA